ncbi:MAG: phosphodiester glycosidase family protein [Planctomycetes bacterium]|nr:phosphodiester glycosidase family protein [Planctomycetota bacterium]
MTIDRTPRILVGLAATATLLLQAPATPAQSKSINLKPGPLTTVAPGLTYAKWEQQGLIAHVTEIALDRPELHLRSIKSKGKESLRELATRLDAGDEKVLCGINGDYFRQSSAAGLPFGGQVSDGRMIFAPMKRSLLSLSPTREPTIGLAELKAKFSFATADMVSDSTWYKLEDVNVPVQEDGKKSGIVLYTPEFLGLDGDRPKGTIAVIETIEPRLQVGDVCTGRVARVEAAGAAVDVPDGGCLLYFYGDSRRSSSSLKPGKPIALKLELPPVTGSVEQAIGGGPRLVRNGKVAVELDKEDFEPVYAMEISKRHPRSAVGFDKEKRRLWLVMVEGRHEGSRGMTFGELAGFLDKLGCWQAMAFDGGGSAGMYVGADGLGFVSRSIGGGGHEEERELANALFVTTRKGQAEGGGAGGAAGGAGEE